MVYIEICTRVPTFYYKVRVMKQRQIHIRIPEDLYKKLKVRCVYGDTTIQGYLIKLLSESTGQHSPEQVSVLIVEDETIIRESLRDWLKDTYVVTTAENGEEALPLISKEDFDILIVDVRLPGKSGLQVLSEAKELKPQMKSIVITAYPSVELAVEAMKVGAVDYLIKPVAPELLERVMLETLQKCKASNNKKALGLKESNSRH
jgi:response regulator RpfG family c-di-GMP phosphodiesterase